MCVAPIDTILRLLLRVPPRIPPGYWPRLILVLLISAIVTIGSLPERLLLGAWLRLRPPKIEPHQAPVFVLGYFRSGTTFLQSLLAADPILRSPRWSEVLAPQTFVVGWMIFRYLFVPFERLMRLDGVAPIAAHLPAEDDFALNNWGGASVLAGRAVLPSQQDFYDRFNDLDDLTPRERARWRAYQLAFVRKLTLTSKGHRLVLKSPSHTARVRYLLDLFPGAKFVHISRPPELVFQSNLLLVRELQRAFALQPPLPSDEQEEIIVREYLATERHYLADRALVPPGDLAEMRLDRLSADPVGEMKRVYRELGLAFSPAFEAALAPVVASFGKRTPNQHPELTGAQKARAARLQPLAASFGYDNSSEPDAKSVRSRAER